MKFSSKKKKKLILNFRISNSNIHFKIIFIFSCLQMIMKDLKSKFKICTAYITKFYIISKMDHTYLKLKITVYDSKLETHKNDP